MARSTNAPASRARKKRILNQAKGFWGLRKSLPKVARYTLEKGWSYAYRDRKAKKRVFRALWIQRINAATRMLGVSYSKFMCTLKEKNIHINRKVLADLAMNQPDAFQSIMIKAGLVKS